MRRPPVALTAGAALLAATARGAQGASSRQEGEPTTLTAGVIPTTAAVHARHDSASDLTMIR